MHPLVLLAVLVGAETPPELPTVDLGGEPLPAAAVDALWAVTREPPGEKPLADWLATLDAAYPDVASPPVGRYVVQAAVGLDRRRRDDLERLLLRQVADEKMSRMSRLRRALLALELGEPTPATARALRPVLDDGFAAVSKNYHSEPLTTGLLRVTRQSPEADRRAAARRACDVLLDEFGRVEGQHAAVERIGPFLAFARLADDDPTARIRAAADALLRVAAAVEAPDTIPFLYDHVPTLLAELPAAEAAPLARRAWDRLLACISAAEEPSMVVLTALTQEAYARWFTDAEAEETGGRVARQVLAALARVRRPMPGDDPGGLRAYLRLHGLLDHHVSVGRRWRADDVRRLADETTRDLLERHLGLEGTSRQIFLGEGLELLRRLRQRVPPADRAASAEAILAPIERTWKAETDPERLAVLAEHLAVVVESHATPGGLRLARAVAGDAARRLVALADVAHAAGIGDRLGPLQEAVDPRFRRHRLLPYAASLGRALAATLRFLPDDEAIDRAIRLLDPAVALGDEATAALTERLADALARGAARADDPRREVAASKLLAVARAPASALTSSPRFVAAAARVADPATIRHIARALWSRLRDSDNRSSLDPVGATPAVLTLRRHLPGEEGDGLLSALAGAYRRFLDRPPTPSPVVYAEALDKVCEHFPPAESRSLREAAVAGFLNAGPTVPLGRPDEAARELAEAARLLVGLPTNRAEPLRARLVEFALVNLPRVPRDGASDRPLPLMPILYPLDRDRRAADLAMALTAGPIAGIGTLPVLVRALPEPPAAELCVELLRHPLCVGDDRRAVLGALGVRYGRTFLDQWDFVRYAEENKLGLDLASPPKRTRSDP